MEFNWVQFETLRNEMSTILYKPTELRFNISKKHFDLIIKHELQLRNLNIFNWGFIVFIHLLYSFDYNHIYVSRGNNRSKTNNQFFSKSLEINRLKRNN